MTAEISILLSAKDETKGAFDAINRQVDGLMSGVGSLQGVLAGAFAGLSISSVMQKFLNETRDAEQEQAQLAAVLRSTGEAAGWSLEKLNDMASELQKNSTFSDGDINKAQTRLLSYTGVVGEQVPRAMQAVIDMSARLGMDLNQSAETIGKALDVPSQGLTALSKQGFRFTDDQKELVKQLEVTGKTAQAQGIILEALESSYGGAAKAARDTFGGAIAALNNNIDSLLTGDTGSMKKLKDTVEGLNKTLESDETKAAFQTLTGWLTEASTAAIRGAANLITFANAKNKLAFVLGTDDFGKMKAEAEGAAAQVSRLVEMAERYQTAIARGENVAQNQRNLDKLRPRIAEAQARAAQASGALKGYADEVAPLPSTLQAGDGKGKNDKKGNQSSSTDKTKDPEAAAKRYLETLSKQVEKAQDLSQVEQTLAEIQRIRNNGGAVSLALEQQLLRTAANVDAAEERKQTRKQTEKEDKERQAAYEKQLDEGRRIMEQMRTPAEAYAAEVQRLNDLLRAGALDQETYSRAVAGAYGSYQEGEKALKAMNSEVDDFAKRAAGNIQDQIGDVLYKSMTGDFDSIGKAWGQLLLRMASEAAAAGLSRALFGDLVQGGSGSGVLGSALKGLGGLLGLSSSSASITKALAAGNAVTDAGGDGLGIFMNLLSGAPKLDTGTNYVPEDMLAVIHKGEKITPARYNRAADPDAAGGGGMVFAPVLHNNIDSRSDKASIVQITQQIVGESLRQFAEQLKRTGAIPS